MQLPSLLISIDHPDPSKMGELIPFVHWENNPDLIRVFPLEDKNSISIDQIHELQQNLNLKPFAERYKITLIYPAHLLTLPAQQALLKTLEEPPENSQVILLTSLPHKLLPTILSRVTQTKVGDQGIRKPEPALLYEKLQQMTVSACIKESDSWSKSREETIEKLRNLVIEIRTLYLQEPRVQLLTHEEKVIHCLEQLERNINIKLALDHLFFTLSGFLPIKGKR